MLNMPAINVSGQTKIHRNIITNASSRKTTADTHNNNRDTNNITEDKDMIKKNSDNSDIVK